MERIKKDFERITGEHFIKRLGATFRSQALPAKTQDTVALGHSRNSSHKPMTPQRHPSTFDWLPDHEPQVLRQIFHLPGGQKLDTSGFISTRRTWSSVEVSHNITLLDERILAAVIPATLKFLHGQGVRRKLSCLLVEMSITKTIEQQPEESVAIDSETVEATEHETVRHPLGVRPSGNALTSEENAASSMGKFATLPDALVLVLLEWLDGPALAALGSTCRGLFAYCSYDQLWRDLAISGTDQDLESTKWRGSWRSTLRKLATKKLPSINCRNVFSDALHRPFLCSRLDVPKYANKISAVNEIPRLANLSVDEFNQAWTDRPFILTESVKHWKVYRTWSWEFMTRQYADISFRAEAVEWSLKRYMDYLHSTTDESPLYLFDRSFVEKMQLDVGSNADYEPPSCFQEDLFAVLGSQRPDHRWLIIGPERSGSTFHKDPNATSAWNAVIRGSKYWIMFPPSVLPPGVFVSDDQSEVTSPLSIAEWLLAFHDEATRTPGCMEGICKEGEVLHVPSGWWHLVVNLDPAIAITQNFVPRSHLKSVVHFLDRKRTQISGFKSDVVDPLKLFLERLEDQYPEISRTLEQNSARKRKWDEVVAAAVDEQSNTGGFSFGFGDDIDSDAE